jgi:DNA-binding transcriptional MerR regulator
MGFFIQEYQDFRGNVVELSALAVLCSQRLNLPGDTDKINERTIRYYVTEGLVDRPSRIGREAEYKYLHLLQFLVSRYLVASGYPMAKVGPYIASRSIQGLAKFVTNPTKPNLAELLVASFNKERFSVYPMKNRSSGSQNNAMQSEPARLSKMQSANDLYDTPAFLRKNPDNNSRRSTNIPNLESKATTSPNIQDLFSSEEISQDLNAKSISYAEKHTQINTQINAESFAKINSELKQEISALHHRMHAMQKEFDHAFAKMSGQLQDQIQEQSHRYRKQTDQLHEALQKLQVEIKQSNEQWREEFQELRKYIEHQILPPIEAERASPSSPPISPKNI